MTQNKVLLIAALSLALVAGLVRAAAPVAAQTNLPVVAQAGSTQVENSKEPAAHAEDPKGATDTDAVEQGDQSGPDNGVTEANEPAGSDTDNIQEGDQSGPDDAGEGPETSGE